jgi:hypothetical protein
VKEYFQIQTVFGAAGSARNNRTAGGELITCGEDDIQPLQLRLDIRRMTVKEK